MTIYFDTLRCNFAYGFFGNQAKEAVHLAQLTNRKIEFEFNGRVFVANGTSTVLELCEQYDSYLKELKKGNRYE